MKQCKRLGISCRIERKHHHAKTLYIVLCILSPFSFIGGIRDAVALASSAPFSNSNNNFNHKNDGGVIRTVAGHSSKGSSTSPSALLASRKTVNDDSTDKRRFSIWDNSHFSSLKRAEKIIKNSSRKRNARSSSNSPSALKLTENDDTVINHKHTSSTIQRFKPLQYLKRKKNLGSEDSWWRYGEYKSPLLTRLTYGYTKPLFEKARNDRLESSDCFLLPDQVKMDTTVNHLTNAYRKEKRAAEDRESLTGKKKSNSMILAKVSLYINFCTFRPYCNLFHGSQTFIKDCDIYESTFPIIVFFFSFFTLVIDIARTKNAHPYWCAASH